MEGLISLREAAKISGYHQDYLSYLIRQNKLPGVRIGRSWGLKKQDLLDFMASKHSDAPKTDNSFSYPKNNKKGVLIYLLIFVLLTLVYVIIQTNKNSANITENNSKDVGQFQTNILYSEEINEFSSSGSSTNSLK